jgi:hypothetical protein
MRNKRSYDATWFTALTSWSRVAADIEPPQNKSLPASS